MSSTARRIHDLDSRTFEARLREHPLVIVPVGALEAHGPHLPLGADQVQAERTAMALAEKVGALVAPTVAYGSCPGARGFPGTVSLSIAELEGHVRGVLAEFARMGVTRLLVLSGHAERGHMAALREAGDDVHRSYPKTRVIVLSDYDFVYELRGELAPPNDGHGGLLETSRVLHLAPELVGPARPVVAERGSPFVPGAPDPGAWPESLVGDTRSASADLGAQIQKHVLARLVTTVESLLPAP